VKKRSITIKGHQTSISLEDAFWDEFVRLAEARNMSIATLVAEIDRNRDGGLSSAIRLYVLAALKQDRVACGTGDSKVD
jgi:predicted DNA-binding ribbon-helix-helix protein